MSGGGTPSDAIHPTLSDLITKKAHELDLLSNQRAMQDVHQQMAHLHQPIEDMKLSDVRSMEDARRLAKHIVQTKSYNIAGLSDVSAKVLLEELRNGDGSYSAPAADDSVPDAPGILAALKEGNMASAHWPSGHDHGSSSTPHTRPAMPMRGIASPLPPPAHHPDGKAFDASQQQQMLLLSQLQHQLAGQKGGGARPEDARRHRPDAGISSDNPHAAAALEWEQSHSKSNSSATRFALPRGASGVHPHAPLHSAATTAAAPLGHPSARDPSAFAFGAAIPAPAHAFNFYSTSTANESPEELEAREQAHRIMVDFIAQKNLTNLLTEKLAEKSHEADTLRARLATGEGKEGFLQMAETLGQYEKELSAERARTLALEQEVHNLRGTLEVSGLPQPRSKVEYEMEINNLRRKTDAQEQMITEIKLRSERERHEIEMAAESRLAKARNQSAEAMLKEVEMLRAKLREKKTVNQELQDMLKLHLRYNSEVRSKNMLNQPQWVHPLLKEPTKTTQETHDRIDL